jgi:uncharacterized protein involved in cysteine biosynthesis
VPCRLCGFHAPADLCPHCGGAPLERSLRSPLRGPLSGLATGVWALPRGLVFVFRTPGVRTWLAAPFVLTFALLVALWSWLFRKLGGWIDAGVPDEVRLERLRAAADDLPRWLGSLVGAVAGALEWLAGAALALCAWAPLRWVGWFLLGSLVLWFLFSLVYEMIAGPFLDEIQARLEARWFGADPRQRIERPNDLPPETCARRTALLAASAAAAFLVLWLVPGMPRLALLAAPLGALPWLAGAPRYREWLAWALRTQTRALVASIQASLFSGALIVLALPLYFVPLWGYPAFAAVCGFATAVGLLDIPFERRGWSRRQRWRFLRHQLPPLAVFGTLAGLLLAIPLVGPLLLVPGASLGGLWLLCRLDKRVLREVESAEPERST